LQRKADLDNMKTRAGLWGGVGWGGWSINKGCVKGGWSVMEVEK